jgi:hypothetical protein
MLVVDVPRNYVDVSEAVRPHGDGGVTQFSTSNPSFTMRMPSKFVVSQ